MNHIWIQELEECWNAPSSIEGSMLIMLAANFIIESNMPEPKAYIELHKGGNFSSRL